MRSKRSQRKKKRRRLRREDSPPTVSFTIPLSSHQQGDDLLPPYLYLGSVGEGIMVVRAGDEQVHVKLGFKSFML
jgi:hypothetical protein